MKTYEIIFKKYNGDKSGYFIKDDFSILNGPYDTVEEAEKDVPKGQLQYPLPMGCDYGIGG